MKKRKRKEKSEQETFEELKNEFQNVVDQTAASSHQDLFLNILECIAGKKDDSLILEVKDMFAEHISQNKSPKQLYKRALNGTFKVEGGGKLMFEGANNMSFEELGKEEFFCGGEYARWNSPSLESDEHDDELRYKFKIYHMKRYYEGSMTLRVYEDDDDDDEIVYWIEGSFHIATEMSKYDYEPWDEQFSATRVEEK